MNSIIFSYTSYHHSSGFFHFLST